jgi:hypothetical protein
MKTAELIPNPAAILGVSPKKIAEIIGPRKYEADVARIKLTVERKSFIKPFKKDKNANTYRDTSKIISKELIVISI